MSPCLPLPFLSAASLGLSLHRIKSRKHTERETLFSEAMAAALTLIRTVFFHGNDWQALSQITNQKGNNGSLFLSRVWSRCKACQNFVSRGNQARSGALEPFTWYYLHHPFTQLISSSLRFEHPFLSFSFLSPPLQKPSIIFSSRVLPNIPLWVYPLLFPSFSFSFSHPSFP